MKRAVLMVFGGALLAACASAPKARPAISAEAITRDVSMKRSEQILSCAKANVAELPKDRCVAYKLRIVPDGSVSEVSVLTKKVGAKFTACLREALSPLTFAEFEVPKPSYQFAQMLNFSGTEGGCPELPKLTQ